ncbi:MAG: FIST C-terminal domain-containing protein [Bacteroidota bacterium]
MVLTTPTLEQIIDSLSADEINLILVGENNQVDIEALISHCNKNNLLMAGGIFPGIIHQNNHSDADVLIKYYPKSTKVKIFKELGKSADFDFSKLQDDQHSALLFIDGLSAKISYFLEKTYSFYWDNIKFIGGGCGSLSLVQQPCIFSNEGFFMDAALMLFLDSDLTAGVKHGWKRISGPFVVSAAEGNIIRELNWRPAFDVYRETLLAHGVSDINPDNFFNIAKAFPFGIFKEGTEDVVRDPIVTDGQSLTCVGEVTVNSVVNILNGEKSDLISGAEQAAMDAFQDTAVKDMLVVDCISRSLFQDDEFSNELDSISQVIKEKKVCIPLEGILSLGEISSYGDGYLEFFNKTIVVGAFQNHDR